MKNILAIGIVAILLLLLVPSVSATWCNNDYGKKAPILINNTGGSEQTHYQVELNYTFDSDMDVNFSDAIVYNESDCSLIPLWNESAVASSWNKIWFNATNIPASAWCNDTYFLYYNYPSASSVSNITNTGAFGDDFDTFTPYDKLFDIVAVEPQERYVSNPILEKNASGWDDYGIRDNCLMTDKYGEPVVEDGKYIMYYSGRTSATGHKGAIGRATFERPNVSTIQNMMKYGSNPILQPSDLSWGADNAQVLPGCVIKNATNDYIMYWYGSTDGTGGNQHIYYATSTDGLSWTPNSTAILTSGQFTLGDIGLPNVREIKWGSDAEKKVMYIEHNAQALAFATSDNWTTGWTPQNSGNSIITASNISWASSGPCNPKFLELGENKYILGMNGVSGNWRGGFMKSTSLDSGWEDYGQIVLDAGSGGEWDDVRIESLELFSNDFGGTLVGMMYFGCPSSDSFADCAIGYTMIDQNAAGECLADWSKTSGVAINTSKCVSSPNSVKIEGSSQSFSHIVALDELIYEVSMRKEETVFDRKYLIELCKGATAGTYIQFGTGDSGDILSWYNGSSHNTLVQPYSTSHWYRIKIVRKGDNLYDVYVDGDKKLTDTTGWNSVTDIDTIKFFTGSTASYSNYLDNLFVRKYASPEPTASLGTEEDAPAGDTYTPPNPTNLQNTTGNFWMNYTWSPDSGNVTNGYNVTWNSSWYNTSNTYMNKSVGASNWANITVWAWNSSGSGTMSAGSVSDQQQAPSVSTKKFYETSTSDFSAEVAVIDLYTSRDATQNNVAYELATGNLYNYINATSNITVGNDIKIPAGTKVNFSAYFDDGNRVDAAYATWKFYRLVGTSTTLICQKGDDSTGGVQIPDGTTETVTGNCSVTSDVTLNSTDKVRLIMNVWAETIGGGGAATKVATHYWDSTHESWVEYKYQLTTTDTTFTVSLPVGYTKPVFEPPNSTATNYPPNGQTSSQEFFNVTNSGNVNLDVRMRLNTTVGTITLKADADNNPTGADTIGTSLVTIHSNLGQGSSVGVWLWSDFDHTPAQTANRTVYINVSQS